MKTVRIIEGMSYPSDEPPKAADHHAITCEIAARIQQLDSILPGDGCSPAGARLISRLSNLYRQSPRAYRLLLDMLSSQESFSLSFEELAARHDHSRQSWLQNAQADVEIVSAVWSEVGEVMRELIKRRTLED
jgi:hypothetical protein